MVMMLQERLRRGIEGVHIRRIKEHLDQQMLEQVLSEALHKAGHDLDGPAPDPKTLSTVILSR